MNNILIGADFVPTKSNYDAFSAGNVQKLIDRDLETILGESAFRIFNLEVPLVDKETPIKKWGPNLIAPTSTIKLYKSINVDLFTLSNNHIMDQGENGLFSTIELLKSNAIGYVGAGKDLEEASIPYIFNFAGKMVGVYACTEHEFSIATEHNPGANPFDALFSFDDIGELKNRTDYVIVLYHGGKEHYRYPSPYLQKVCRRMVDKGANLIICQHSHCIGCFEEYKSGTIVYGQGNFLFDHSTSEYWQTSILISLSETFHIDFIPIVKNEIGVELAKGQKKEEILSCFRKRSEEIKDDGFVESQYIKFSKEMLDFYLSFLGGKKSLLIRGLNKLSNNRLFSLINATKYGVDQRLALINYLECEAHRELFVQGLKNNNDRPFNG